MKQNALLMGLVGVLVGAGITYVIMGKPPQQQAASDHAGQMEKSVSIAPGEHGESMTMTDMTAALLAQSGDAFDRAFIEMMIDHHQGAIDMANLAKARAVHQEIRAMADEIISAQSTEINQMNGWYTAWGYRK